MAWRKPTQDDLTARLSQRELDAFSRSAVFSLDVVEGVLAQSAAFARDAVRSGGLSPEDGAIPEGLFRPGLAIAILDLLNRFSLQPTDARREAARAGESYLGEVAAGKITPESYAADDAVEAKGAGPLADEGPVRTLGGGLW